MRVVSQKDSIRSAADSAGESLRRVDRVGLVDPIHCGRQKLNPQRLIATGFDFTRKLDGVNAVYKNWLISD
jgi:hypothetical protein